MLKKIRLADIRVDGETQPRAKIDNATVSEYAEELLAKKKFPPLEVYHDGCTYWLADGFHRFFAFQRIKAHQVDADVIAGTLQDAQWASLNKNHSHGLRRTNEDKRKAVETALKMRSEMSDRALADWCGVSDHFVGNIREQIEVQVRTVRTCQPSEEAPKRIGKDGKSYPAPPMPPTEDGGKIVPFPPVPMEPEKPKSPPRPRDMIGREIPTEAMETWTRKGEAQDILRNLSTIRGYLRKAQEQSDPFFAEIHVNNLLADVDNLYANLKGLEPYAVCPSCQGMIGCRLCGGRRMISKFKWDNAVTDIQKKRAQDEAEKISG